MSVMLALYWLEQQPESVTLMEHGVVLLNLHPNMSILFIHAHNMILSTCLSIAQNLSSIYVEWCSHGIHCASCVLLQCCSCIFPAPCPELLPLANGLVLVTMNPVEGDIAIYECFSGFFLVGTAARVCQSDGTWSSSAPVCEEIICTWIFIHVMESLLLFSSCSNC